MRGVVDIERGKVGDHDIRESTRHTVTQTVAVDVDEEPESIAASGLDARRREHRRTVLAARYRRGLQAGTAEPANQRDGRPIRFDAMASQAHRERSDRFARADSLGTRRRAPSMHARGPRRCE